MGNFSFNPRVSSNGGVFENFILRKLIEDKEAGRDINKWRSKTGAEVDFVVGGYLKPVPIEIKMTEFKGKVKYGKSFYSFLDKYKPKTAYIYNLDTSAVEKIKNTKVYIRKYFE